MMCGRKRPSSADLATRGPDRGGGVRPSRRPRHLVRRGTGFAGPPAHGRDLFQLTGGDAELTGHGEPHRRHQQPRPRHRPARSRTDAAAQYPAAAAIQAVVTQYFTAINDRDYGAYMDTQTRKTP